MAQETVELFLNGPQNFFECRMHVILRAAEMLQRRCSDLCALPPEMEPRNFYQELAKTLSQLMCFSRGLEVTPGRIDFGDWQLTDAGQKLQQQYGNASRDCRIRFAATLRDKTCTAISIELVEPQLCV